MHSTIEVEFFVILQNPGFTLITSPPSHTVSTIHLSHIVLFHSREKVPGNHLLHLFSIICSPGLQNLSATSIKLSLTTELVRIESLFLLIAFEVTEMNIC